MKASEIMTTDVITVNPDTSVGNIAARMTEHRISGVPVVDGAGELVGIVSESDLLHRAETGTERKRKWWLSLFVDADELAREYRKAHGLRAADIMSTAVTTVDAGADLSEVAELLNRQKLKRVPVVDQGRLVGIVTRGDLVRALAQVGEAAPTKAASTEAVDDDALYSAIADRMEKAQWLNAIHVNTRVQNGVVELNGSIASSDQRRALRVLIEETPGVVAVRDHLRVGPITMSG